MFQHDLDVLAMPRFVYTCIIADMYHYFIVVLLFWHRALVNDIYCILL